MSFDGMVDPDTAAGVAELAMEQTLGALPQAVASARAAAEAAANAQAAQDAIKALLSGLGLPVRWTGTSLQIRLPDGSYTPAVDLQGVIGPVGPAPNLKVGTVTGGDFSVVIHLDDPKNPVIDFVLPQGLAAWTPVPAAVIDGDRRVLQIVEWVGGQGAKPQTGLYVGATGLVATLANAADFRGLPGGIAVVGQPTASHLAVWDSASGVRDGGALTAFGSSLIAAASAAAVKVLLSIGVGDVAGAAPSASPALTGTPTAPTAPLGTNTTQVATMAAIANAVADLVNSAPGALNTLKELADAIGDDPNYAATVTNALAAKLAKASNLSDVVDPTAARTNLGLAIGSNVQAWDTDLDAIAALGTTSFGRGLLTQTSVATLKTLLAYVAGDISGLGNAATRNVGTISGTVAAGDDSRFTAASGAPSAFNTRALPNSATAADKGTAINPTGTGALSLTAATAVAGWFAFIKKRDEGGAATLTPATGTIDGLPSIVVYKEDLTVYYDAAASTAAGSPVYRTQGRQRGYVDFGTFTVASGTSGVSITAGANDPEIRDLQVQGFGYVGSAASVLLAAFLQNGTAGSLQGEASVPNTTTSSASSINSTSLSLTSGTTTNPVRFKLDVFNVKAATAGLIGVNSVGSTAGTASLQDAAVTTAGALSAVNLTPNTGTISSLTYNVRLYRP